MLLAVLAVALVGAWFGAPPPAPERALDAVPRGSFLVATIDLTRLRASPLAAELGVLQEVSDVASRCGFNPLARAKVVAVAVPEEENGEFGLAVTHDLSPEEIRGCASRVMAERGASPRLRQEGAYWVLDQDEGGDGLAQPEIAYRQGAPLLVGRGAWLTTMRKALDREVPRLDAKDPHSALRAAVTGPDAPAVVVSAVLPRRLRERLKREMAGEAEGHGAATMDAVLSVSEAAASLTLHDAGRSMHLAVHLVCEDAASCETVRAFLERKRSAIASRPGAHLVGIGQVLDAVHLEAHGAALDATLDARVDDVIRAARAAWKYGSAPAPAQPLDAGVALHPDEVLRARDR